MLSLTSFVKEELERPDSSFGEEEKTDDEVEAEEQKRSGEKQQRGTQCRVLTPTQPVRSSPLNGETL